MIEALKIDVGDDGKRFIVDNILKILDSDYQWTNGEYVGKFEEAFQTYTGAAYASAVSSGSSAIEISLEALGLDEYCIAFVPTLTAPPTVYSCIHAGLEVVYIDCNEVDFGMSVDDLENKIECYKGNKKGVIIPVHIGGIVSKDIETIIDIAKKYDLFVIEDCAHAHGSYYKELHAGRRGDVGVFSFFLTKVLTCGEGGMIITDNKEIHEKCNIIRNYGKVNGKHVMKGSSWRMNEFTAVVGWWQVLSAEALIGARREIAKRYDIMFSGNSVYRLLKIDDEIKSSYYKYILRTDLGFNLEEARRFLREKYEIVLPSNVYEIPCHKEPVFRNKDQILNKHEKFPNSEFVSCTHICLPIYPDIKEEEMEKIVDALNEYAELKVDKVIV